MLVVGDLSVKQIDPKTEVNSVEIIVKPDREEELLKFLELNNKSSIKVGDYIKLFRKNSVSYIIISTEASPYLSLLLKNSMAINSLKIATPAMNYIFLSNMVNYRFKCPLEWIKTIKQVEKLRPYFYNSIITSGRVHKYLRIGEKLSDFLCNLNHMNSKPILRFGYQKYSKYEILSSIGCSVNSGFKQITIPGNNSYFNFDKWRSMSLLMKKITLMEILYVITINDYIIPHHKESYPNEEEIKQLFLHAIMDFAIDSNNTYTSFIQNFLLENLDEIIKSYKTEIIQKFIESEKNKTINKLLSW